MAAAIAEELGEKDLQKLRGRDFDAFYDGLGRRGLSATSVRRYHAVCSASLNQAVRWGLLERSPAAQATPPSLESNEPEAPTPEEVKLLIERAQSKDPELATLLFVAATTGCRRGEPCGLQWSDVDLKRGASPGPSVGLRSPGAGRAPVDQDRPYPEDGTRPGHGRRPGVAGGGRRARRGSRSTSGSGCVRLVPCTGLLEPLRPGGVTSRFIALRNELGLKHIKLHHLRHFAATVMLAAGVDVRTVAGGLGHSRPTLTLQTCAHVMEVTDRRAAAVVGGSISGTHSGDVTSGS